MTIASDQEPAADNMPRREQKWGRVIPDTVGVGIGAIIIAGALSVALAANLMLARQAKLHESARGQLLAEAVAAVLGAAAAEGEPPADVNRALGALGSFQSITWSDPAGSVRFAWPPAPTADQAAAAPASDETPNQAYRATVLGTDGAPLGTAVVRPALARAGDYRPTLIGMTALVLFSALLLYLVLCRHLRAHVRPIEAVKDNLHRYALGIERELLALGLSDSMGETAHGWNQLIQQAARLEQQVSPGASPEDALSRFESRSLRRLLDRLPVGVVRVNNDRQVKYANACATQLLGGGADGIVGRPLEDVIGAESAEPLLEARPSGSQAHALDRRIGDEQHPMTIRLQMLRSAAGDDDEPVLFVSDVSPLFESRRIQDSFLYHVTHELRTPLTNIQAYAETLSQPDFDDEQTRKECYNVIISETRRLSALIEDILSLSQLEIGKVRIEWNNIDIARLLREMVQDNLAAADEKQVELRLKLPPKVPPVRGDKKRLAVLLNNLIGNAIKYTRAGGGVEVVMVAQERCVEIAVSDTGIGIDPGDHERVFDKFYRADSEEVRGIKGTGLGLAIAREVARLHGGDITLDSEPDKGSTFTIELPVEAEARK